MCIHACVHMCVCGVCPYMFVCLCAHVCAYVCVWRICVYVCRVNMWYVYGMCGKDVLCICICACICGIHVPVCVFIHVCAHSLVGYSLLVLLFAAAKQGVTQSVNPGFESELHPG